MLLSSVQPQHALATPLVFCMVAGLSERLVPSLVERVEATAGKPEAGATIVQEASAKQAEKGKDGTYTFYGRAADDKVSGKRFFDRFEDRETMAKGNRTESSQKASLRRKKIIKHVQLLTKTNATKTKQTKPRAPRVSLSALRNT